MVHLEDNINEKQRHKILKSFISGGIAGSLNKTIIAPIERVKYLFVTSNRTFTYRHFVEDFLFIARKNGIFNLWRGNTMNIYRMFPYSAIDFAVFDFMRGIIYNKEQKTLKSRALLFLCGSISGLCALTATDPLQFVRIRLAMEKTDFTYANSLQAFKIIYKKQGFLGFYKGYGAASIGVIIYQGIAFSLYTRLKEYINDKNPALYTKWYIDGLFGGISALGQIIAYPLDTLRKRMQGQLLLIDKGLLQKKQSYRQLIYNIYHFQRGVKGFFKGVTLNLIKAPLASASAWTMKNIINRKLNSFYDF